MVARVQRKLGMPVFLYYSDAELAQEAVSEMDGQPWETTKDGYPYNIKVGFADRECDPNRPGGYVDNPWS